MASVSWLYNILTTGEVVWQICSNFPWYLCSSSVNIKLLQTKTNKKKPFKAIAYEEELGIGQETARSNNILIMGVCADLICFNCLKELSKHSCDYNNQSKTVGVEGWQSLPLV